jgi:PAS domain S-box-containing protein
MTVHADNSRVSPAAVHPGRKGRRAVEPEFLASIVDSSDDAIFSKTLDGVITSWNRAAERIYGYQAAEIIGRSVSLLIPADRPDEMVEILDRIRAGKRVGHYETTRRTKDGGIIAISLIVSPIQDAAGAISGASSIAHVITTGSGRRRAQARAALRYSRSLIEASLDPLVTISPEGKITDVNEAAIRATGVARQRLIGTDFAGHFTEPDRAHEAYRQVFAHGFVTDYPLTISHADGGLTDVLYTAPVYKDMASNVLGVLAAVHGRVDSEGQIRDFSETKTLLDSILQSSTKYSIIGMDLDHRILFWNKGASRNYGYTAQEVIGKDSNVLHTPADVESGAVNRLRASAYKDGMAEDTFERVRKDGSRFTASVVVTRRDDAMGDPVGFLLMSHDISEKQQAEDQLRTTALYTRNQIDASLDVLVTISPEGKLTDVNKAAIRATGEARAHLLGSDFSGYFTEPDRARQAYRQVFAQGSVADYPLTISHAGGGLTDVLYTASVYHDEAGHVLGAFAAARDVTAQRRAESEAAERRARELERLAELERFQRLTVGRELRMIELKKEIEDLRAAGGGK